MSETTDELAIMFMDLDGARRLYNAVGDYQAKENIDAYLTTATQIVEQCHGIVIKSIGEGLMCRFGDANDAVNAACLIHETMNANPPVNNIALSAMIGLNYGSVIQENDDVFGDAVNLAARVKSLARPGQVMTTEPFVAKLNESTSPIYRSVDRTQVKGKQEEITIYEVLWQPQDATSLFGIYPDKLQDNIRRITLRYRNQEKEVSSEAPELVMGRDEGCDLIITSKEASRMHAHIAYRRGKFILLDHSTNGTMIQTRDGKSTYLRREELPLWGRGMLSLGKPLDESDSDLVHFICY